MKRTATLLVPLVAALALLVSVVPGATAKDGDGRVIETGNCSGNSNWKLKAKPDDGGLEVEFEVDQNRSGVNWRVAIGRNGNRFVNTRRKTRGRSGSFSIERRTADGAGTDVIRAVAKRRGETCRAALRI